MKTTNYFATVLILLLVAFGAQAQQDAMYTHYMFNTLSVNPAYAGSRDALTITGLHRTQWAGFEGAPNTQTITAHTPIIRDNFGVGLSLVKDKIGPTSALSINLDLAYHMQINEQGHQLALGLKAGGNIVQNDLASLSLDAAGDNAFASSTTSEFLPNFGFGAYYYTDRWYVGASTPQLVQNTFKYSNMSTAAEPSAQQRHYFLIGGAVFGLTETIKLKPTTLLKLTEGAPTQLDLTGSLLFDDKFWLGAMWRSGDALGALVGYQFTPQLAAGYSFDFSYTNTTFRYNGGSHEIMLRYDFIYRDKGKVKSPRYF